MKALQPADYFGSIKTIDYDALLAAGIDTLLIDLDNTILPRNSEHVPDEAIEWASNIRGRGFKVCIVSNNWHDRVCGVAETLGFELVSKALKPLPFAFLVALRRLGSTRRRSIIIGDQIFTDVLGGRLLGIRTCLVLPMSSSDLPHTLVLRRLERLVLAGRMPVA